MNWRGLVIVKKAQHLDRNGNILWEANNLHNLLHTTGEEFILSSCFIGGNNPSAFIPDNYYFGLDNRLALDAGDDMSDVTSVEPSTNGYQRQVVSSEDQMTLTQIGGINQVNSPVLSFSASGGAWGPVRNLFMTTEADDSGYLIGSVELSQALTLLDGEIFTVNIGLSLKDCPA